VVNLVDMGISYPLRDLDQTSQRAMWAHFGVWAYVLSRVQYLVTVG